MLGDLFNRVNCGIPALVTGSDVQESDLISALLVIPHGDFHRVAGIADPHEVDAFDHATAVNIQAGDHSLRQPHQAPASSHKRWASATSSVPS